MAQSGQQALQDAVHYFKQSPPDWVGPARINFNRFGIIYELESTGSLPTLYCLIFEIYPRRESSSGNAEQENTKIRRLWMRKEEIGGYPLLEWEALPKQVVRGGRGVPREICEETEAGTGQWNHHSEQMQQLRHRMAETAVSLWEQYQLRLSELEWRGDLILHLDDTLKEFLKEGEPK